MSERTTAGEVTPNWLADFMLSMKQGRANPSLLKHLDDFLRWHLSVNATVQQAGVQQALAEFGESGLRKRFEEVVDQLAIANPNNYQQLFPEDLAADMAKIRYRQLIGVFHPDRGENDDVWLTYRVERVKAAYQQYIDTLTITATPHTSPEISQNDLNREPLHVGSRKRSRSWAFRYSRANLRKWFGNPKQLQRRIIVFVTGLGAFVIIILLLSTIGA